MFGLFKASNPPTFGDVIWKLILRIVALLLLIFIGPYALLMIGMAFSGTLRFLLDLVFA